MFRFTKATALLGAAVFGVSGGSYWLYQRGQVRRANLPVVTDEKLSVLTKDGSDGLNELARKQQSQSLSQQEEWNKKLGKSSEVDLNIQPKKETSSSAKSQLTKKDEYLFEQPTLSSVSDAKK